MLAYSDEGLETVTVGKERSLRIIAALIRINILLKKEIQQCLSGMGLMSLLIG